MLGLYHFRAYSVLHYMTVQQMGCANVLYLRISLITSTLVSHFTELPDSDGALVIPVLVLNCFSRLVMNHLVHWWVPLSNHSPSVVANLSTVLSDIFPSE